MRSGKCSADGQVSSQDKTLPPTRPERNEESFGNEERERTAVVPMIVGTIDVRVDPTTFVVAVGAEHVRIAVGIV